MTDMDAFDRLIAKEVEQAAAPPRPVDDAAIFTAITTTQSPKWRFQTMFTAAKLVVAGAIVALFGGFLINGILPTQPSEQEVPAAELDAAAQEGLLFALVMDAGPSGRGEFTGYDTIPAGTVSVVDGVYAPPSLSATYLVDPAPPGGDTFTIVETGQVKGELPSGTFHARGHWKILPFQGTGIYEGMAGEGEAFVLSQEGDWAHIVYLGTLAIPAE